MAKLGSGFDSNGYTTVAERIQLFYSAHPLGRIETHLMEHTEREIVFKAVVFRGPTDKYAAATGWAAERIGDGEINSVACLENTETSAVGRALANLGLTGSRRRPSAEEMARASRTRARLALGTAPAQQVGASGDDAASADPRGATIGHSTVARDLLNLLDRAALLGIRESRVTRWKAVVTTNTLASGDLLRCERRLRVWIERHRNLALM